MQCSRSGERGTCSGSRSGERCRALGVGRGPLQCSRMWGEGCGSLGVGRGDGSALGVGKRGMHVSRSGERDGGKSRGVGRGVVQALGVGRGCAVL